VFLNPDVQIQDADVDALGEYFEHTPLGLVALSVVDEKQGAAHPQTFARATWWGGLTDIALGPFRPHELPLRSRRVGSHSADWVAGALILVRRSEFMDLGGFDERFFLYYEDQELGIRYRGAGLPIKGTDAIIGAHVAGHSSVDGDERIAPTAWSVLGWLEFVAMEHGRRRARTSWRLVTRTHRFGSNVAEWTASVTGTSRLRRKAEQLRAVDAKVVELARAGSRSEHNSCPEACRVVCEVSQR
jgi:GT2 family glycosyltransferase